MKNKIGLFLKVSLAMVVVFSGFGTRPSNISSVDAKETSITVNLKIDENASELDIDFDEIGGFSEDGIAIVRKLVDGHYLNGLINLNGELVAEIKYTDISNYNDKYYLISENFGEQVGLLSKGNGDVVLEPQYNRIPIIKEDSLVELYKTTNETDKRFKILKYYSNNAGFENVSLPNVKNDSELKVSFSDYKWFGINTYSGLTLISARKDNSEIHDNWFIDEKGNAISDVFKGYITGYIKYGEAVYFSLYKTETNNQLGKGGLYRVDYDADDSTSYIDLVAHEFGANGDLYFIYIDSTSKEAYYSTGEGAESMVYSFESNAVSKKSFFIQSPQISSEKVNEKLDVLGLEVYHDETPEKYALKDKKNGSLGQVIYERFAFNKDLNTIFMYKTVEFEKIERPPNKTRDAYFINESMIDGETTLNYKLISNMQHINLRELKQDGYAVVHKYIDDFGKEFENSWTGLVKSGIISDKGKVILQLEYDYISNLYFEKEFIKESENIYLVEKIIKNNSCSLSKQNENTDEYYTDCLTERKIYDVEKERFFQWLEKDLVFDGIPVFDDEGYAYITKNSNGINEDSKNKIGLVHYEKGVILGPEYNQIGDATPNSNSSPGFGKDGYIKIYKDNKVGIASKEKIIFDAEYQDAYYKDGNFYLKNDELKWTIEGLDGRKQTVTLPKKFEDKINYIELIGKKLDEKLLIRSTKSSSFGEYFKYGVLDEEGEVFLDLEYSDIEYLGDYWKLAKQDPDYQTAIMKEDGSYIIPFDSGYDSLSKFVGGYSIGKKEYNQEDFRDYDNPSYPGILMSQIFNFMPIYANNNDFVLDVLDTTGEVVGDLSKQFEAATLLGVNKEDQIKALVKQDGVYKLATLVVSEKEAEPDTGGEETPVIPDKPIVPGPTIPDAGDSQGPDAILPEEDKPVEHSFKDVPEKHEFYEYIMYLAENDITTGYTTGPKAGSFGINENLSRRHAAVFLFRAMNLEKGSKFEGIFNDVKETESGAYEIEAIYRAGIITGYTNDDGSRSFKPKDNLTRAQFAKMTVEAYQLEQDVNKELTFTDLLAINETDPTWWANDYIKALVDNNIVDGYKVDNTFRPNGLMTRGHLSKFLYNAEKTK